MNKAIKKIELDLGGKIVSLTPEQAKNLKDALDDLFGEKVVRIIEKEYVPLPFPHPIDRYPRESWRPYWEWSGSPYQFTTTAGTTQYCSNTESMRLTA